MAKTTGTRFDIRSGSRKAKSQFMRLIFSRGVLSALMIAVQVVWLCMVYLKVFSGFKYFDLIIRILTTVYVIYIINNKTEKLEYKLSWIVIILAFPVFGVPFYALFGNKRPGRSFKRRLDLSGQLYAKFYRQKASVPGTFKKFDLRGYRISKYIFRDGGYPVYDNSEVTYLSPGEAMYSEMLSSMRKAEKFIFLEFFIIEDAEVWGSIREILVEKARDGVDVRLMYDDFGCIAYLPRNYYRELEAMSSNIKCYKYNPIVPFFSPFMNNRDHRKLLIVDGNEAYTGGLNLSDRYVNINSPFGHWKDAGVKVRGEAVTAMTLMFLEMWNAVGPVKKLIDKVKEFGPDRGDELQYEDIRFTAKYMPVVDNIENFKPDGFIQPYGDEPFDNVMMSENVYMEMISQSAKYLYIYTPYLIMSDELTGAICVAAKSGVDVRIVTPGVPDKKLTYRVTRSSYTKLMAAGVKIYEYTPGFIHAKCVLVDGKYATVGTVNFDYRSLFLHFENGVFFADCSAVKALEEDMRQTFEVSHRIEDGDIKVSAVGRVFDSVLGVMAPML